MVRGRRGYDHTHKFQAKRVRTSSRDSVLGTQIRELVRRGDGDVVRYCRKKRCAEKKKGEVADVCICTPVIARMFNRVKS